MTRARRRDLPTTLCSDILFKSDIMYARPDYQAEDSKRQLIFKVILTVLAVALAAAGGFIYWTETHKNDDLYARLQMTPLPNAVERSASVSVQLDQLRRFPCDTTAIVALAEELKRLGYNNDSAAAIVNFKNLCAGRSSGPAVAGAGSDPLLINLSLSPDERTRELAKRLRDSPCSQPITLNLIFALQRTEAYREASGLGESFLARCTRDSDIGYNTTKSFFWTGRYDQALKTIEMFEPQLASNYYFAVWRGFIYERQDRHEEAAQEFERALGLAPDLRDLDVSQFYFPSRAYRAAGQYCKAIKPLELYVGLAPESRLTPEISAAMADLRRLGNCH